MTLLLQQQHWWHCTLLLPIDPFQGSPNNARRPLSMPVLTAVNRGRRRPRAAVRSPEMILT